MIKVNELYDLPTISKFGTLEFDNDTNMYYLSLKLVTNYSLVVKIFNELVSVSDSDFKFTDFIKDIDIENNSKFATYMNINIRNISIDGLILKFVSKFRKGRYDA